MIYRFDQTIQSCSKMSGGDDWKVIYREMQAQLYFHAGTLLLKRAQQVLVLDCIERVGADGRGSSLRGAGMPVIYRKLQPQLYKFPEFFRDFHP